MKNGTGQKRRPERSGKILFILPFMAEPIQRERIMLPVSDGDSIAIERFYTGTQGIPVLMVHGSVENGRIFYSSSGKGLAPFLAREGYDVFVMDMRGKGNSEPRVSRRSTYSQFETITGDIPFTLQKISELKGNVPVQLVAHSWGGVLLLSWFARFSNSFPVRSMVFFGSKRKIYIKTWKKLWMVDFFWNFIGRTVSFFKGYLPAVWLRFGSDNESRNFFLETNHWVYADSWIDRRDGFNYHEAFKALTFPPILSLTGSQDHTLGNPHDVKELLKETGSGATQFVEVGKMSGYQHDYGHIDLLTHPDAPDDHFQLVLEWMNTH